MAKGASYRYYYDLAGNITKRETYDFSITGLGDVKKTETLGYNDSSWGDRLTSWQGTTITYDEIGNPTWYSIDYLTCLLTWNGRQLASFENMDGLRTYTYNDEGIRIAKNDRGTLHTYQVNGTQIVSETWGIHTIFYVYDEMGAIAGMRYRTSNYAEGVFDEYLFEKNLQGDVVAIYNASGVKLVSYTYDAWGKVTTTYHNNGASTPARFNPFKYRGYYHDSDTGLYYLNSRYYDPATGRFISADVYVSTGQGMVGNNMYVYGGNDPVNHKDDGGEFWDTVFDVVSLCFSVAEVVANPTDVWAWAGLVGDAVDLIPFVSGVGEVTRAVSTGRKVLKAADDLHDAGKAIDNAADAIDGTIDTYKALKKADSSIGKEVHHIVEKRFAKSIGIENTDEMLSIALDKQTHRKFTNLWRGEFKYGTNYNDIKPSQVWRAAQKIYAGYPELLEAARKTIFN